MSGPRYPRSEGQARTYRSLMRRPGLVAFEVSHRETDLHIQAQRPMEKEVSNWVIEVRLAIETYGARRPDFFTSLVPLPDDPFAPPVVRDMLRAGLAAGTGPMAAVAGAVAEYVGVRCQEKTGGEVIVENGGDVFVSVNGPFTAALWAGRSPFSGRIGIRIDPGDSPLGVCTSSGTVGHSLSLGTADAVTIVARSCAFADAVATSVGNRIKDVQDLARAIKTMDDAFPGIIGAVIVKDERLGAWGEVELVPL